MMHDISDNANSIGIALHKCFMLRLAAHIYILSGDRLNDRSMARC